MFSSGGAEHFFKPATHLANRAIVLILAQANTTLVPHTAAVDAHKRNCRPLSKSSSEIC